MFRSTEEVYDVDVLIDFAQVRATGFVQNGVMLGIDGQNAIPGLLHVLWDPKCILARMIFDPDDGNGSRGLENRGDRLRKVLVVCHEDFLEPPLEPPFVAIGDVDSDAPVDQSLQELDISPSVGLNPAEFESGSARVGWCRSNGRHPGAQGIRSRP